MNKESILSGREWVRNCDHSSSCFAIHLQTLKDVSKVYRVCVRLTSPHSMWTRSRWYDMIGWRGEHDINITRLTWPSSPPWIKCTLSLHVVRLLVWSSSMGIKKEKRGGRYSNYFRFHVSVRWRMSVESRHTEDRQTEQTWPFRAQQFRIPIWTRQEPRGWSAREREGGWEAEILGISHYYCLPCPFRKIRGRQFHSQVLARLPWHKYK